MKIKNLKNVLLLFFILIGCTPALLAQNAAFGSFAVNPFGLSPIGSNSFTTFVDLDNDSDLDMFVGEYNDTTYKAFFIYYENTGTSTLPNFSSPPQFNPFNLDSVILYAKPTFADLDNDGDEDLLVGEGTGDIQYFENIGSASTPNFSTPIANPFGLTSSISSYLFPEFCDLDNDGDFDLLAVEMGVNAVGGVFKYFENLGSPALPNYSGSTTNPFGLTPPMNTSFTSCSLGDLDQDGDLDIITSSASGTFSIQGGYFYYFENLGSSNVPNYTSPIINPFGIVTPTAETYPCFVDLNYDGRLDIMSGEFQGNYLYYENLYNTGGPLVVWNVSINTPSCSPGGDGSVNITANGGIPPYLFKIANDSNTTGILNGLTPGTHLLRIKDSLGSFVDTMITINQPTPPTLQLSQQLLFHVSCSGLSDGLLVIPAMGGTLPHTYSLIKGGIAIPGGPHFTNLDSGSYVLYVTDGKNCKDSTFVQINDPLPITISTTVQHVVNGGTNGSITAIAGGGTGAKTYTISPNAGNQSPPGVFTGLGIGTYTITATDANGCVGSTTAVVNFSNSISSINKPHVEIFPNPTTDILNIRADKDITRLEILDLTGKVVQTVNSKLHTLSLKGLPSGLFVLRIMFEGKEQYHVRIVKE